MKLLRKAMELVVSAVGLLTLWGLPTGELPTQKLADLLHLLAELLDMLQVQLWSVELAAAGQRV